MPNDQKKKTGRQNYPWGKIKHEYVTSPDATLRKIAEKYGITYWTVAKKSKADNWFAARNEHQSRVVSRAISQTEDQQVYELAQEKQFLERMKERMADMLSDQDQFHRHLTTNIITGVTEENIYEKVDTKALKDSMQVLKMIEDMSRSLYNLQRAADIQKHQIDAERMQLEREKFEFEKQKTEFFKPDTSNKILIAGYESEWAE